MNRIVDAPTVLSTKDEAALTLAESAFALRLISILETDYFVRARVSYGKMSHGLPIYIGSSREPIDIVLDADSSSVSIILNLYREDITSFGGMAKDFIRNIVFPKIAHLVPSSTRQGAEAFLRAIKQPRDVFEYEKADQSSLSDIWEKYLQGEISLVTAARQSAAVARTSVQSFDSSSTARAVHVIPDVMNNQKILDAMKETDTDELDAMPAITRLDVESTAKLLTIEEGESPLRGYRCFVAISDRARKDRGEFFLQPHRTEIVWGGQKVWFIFQHHSREFGLYYELQADEILSDTPGGRSFPTSTIILKNQIYIPVPGEISEKFVPKEAERKRFEVSFELLYPQPEDNSR
jgi:molecular chaperone HtpG